ncbi:MAG: GRP family sugar transporter [Nitrososphaerales archaeon]
MVDYFGIGFAFIAAASWGTYLVPIKKFGITNIFHTQGAIGIGAILFALAMVPFYGSMLIDLAGISAGAIWVTASTLAIFAIKYIGLGRVAPLVGSMIIITSFLWGLLFFNEQLSSLAFAIIGIAMLASGMPLIAIGERKAKDIKGYLLTVIAGILWGSLFVPVQLFSNLENSFFSMSLAIFVIGTGILIATRRFRKRETLTGIVSGAIWNVGNIASFLAVAALGLTVGYPLTQLALLFNVSWGLLYFREASHRKSFTAIYIGATIVIIGSIFLSYSSG